MSPFRRRHTEQRKPRKPLLWLAIISIVAVILAVILGLGGGAINFIENYFGYRDDSYRPMDTERHDYETVKERSKPPDQSKP